MATISVICYKSKTLANGEHPLALRITKDGKRSYKYLGISVNPKHWNFKKNIPRLSCPNRDLIKQITLDKESEFQTIILEKKSSQKSYTAKTLINAKNNPRARTLEEVFTCIIADFEKSDKLGNAKVYRETYNSIIRYTKLSILDFHISEITAEWLSGYEKWFIASNNKSTTISLRFRTLRSVFNKAIEMNCVSKEDYPFDSFRVSKFNTKTKKRSISKTEIKQIMNLNLSEETYLMQLSRDIFIFSYLHGGINLTDIANLKLEDIQANRIEYIRQKTGQNISVPLLDEGRRIIEKHRADTKSIYVFPILNESIHKTAQQKFDRIHKYIGHINKYLKTIGNMANIETPLTTYVARHSFATVLKRSGVNTAIISESLGHSSEKVTQIYLDSFENSQIDDAMKNLL